MNIQSLIIRIFPKTFNDVIEFTKQTQCANHGCNENALLSTLYKNGVSINICNECYKKWRGWKHGL